MSESLTLVPSPGDFSFCGFALSNFDVVGFVLAYYILLGFAAIP